MLGFLGEYEVSIDAKGRLMLPAGFKKQLGEADGYRFVLNRGIDDCLTLYTEKQWAGVAKIINRLNDFNKKARELKRNFLNGATVIEPDSAGRILLPKSMLAYAQINKSVIFTAQMNKVEIWDAERYRKQNEASLQDMDALAQEVLGASFLNPLDDETAKED